MQVLSLPRAEFRLGISRRQRKPTARQRVLGRTLLGRAARVAGTVGVAGGGYALLRRKGGAMPTPSVAPMGPKPRTAKQLANSAKVARRRAHIGKAAKAVEGGTKGRVSAERRIISSRVKKGASAARSRLGANYRSHHRLSCFSQF